MLAGLGLATDMTSEMVLLQLLPTLWCTPFASAKSVESVMPSAREHVAQQPTVLIGGSLRPYQLAGLQFMASLWNNQMNGVLLACGVSMHNLRSPDAPFANAGLHQSTPCLPAARS